MTEKHPILVAFIKLIMSICAIASVVFLVGNHGNMWAKIAALIFVLIDAYGQGWVRGTAE